jgi:hypothetical protein
MRKLFKKNRFRVGEAFGNKYIYIKQAHRVVGEIPNRAEQKCRLSLNTWQQRNSIKWTV